MGFQLQGICPLLQVFDMPTALAFYRGVLGFEVIAAAPHGDKVSGDNFGWAWLRRDGTELMLNTAYDPDAIRPLTRDPARVAAHDDTILYIGCPDVDAVYHHLCARGVNVDPPAVAQYGMKQLYVKDPDGFTLCFQWAVKEQAPGI